MVESEQVARLIDDKVTTIVYRELRKLGILQGNKITGKVASISGNVASVYINGSSQITSNIPIRYGLIINPNDEVWIERVNFNDVDLEISSKRNVTNENWTDWINVSNLQNGWVYYGSPFATVGYKKDAAGNVHFKGLIKGGTVGITTVLFVLPDGYRPSERRLIDTISDTGQARFDIDTNGNVYIVSGGNGWFSLDDKDLQL